MSSFDTTRVKKIFCIGLSKTGTKSISKALEILGYTGTHYMSPEKYLLPLLANRNPALFNWRPLLWYNDFFADIPIPKYYRQLDRLFPDSRFIITLRDNKDEWLESCQHQFDSVMANHQNNEYEEWHMKLDNHSLVRLIQYGIVNYDRQTLSDYYDVHLTGVRDYFKDSDRLLEFDMTTGDGWDKLCDFLGKEVPDKPFPHQGARSKE